MDGKFLASKILVPSCGAQGLELRYQGWIKVPLPTKQSLPN